MRLLVGSLFILFTLRGTAFADQIEYKQWEFRIGIGHASTFYTAPGAPWVDGIIGQVQYNLSRTLFIQGTAIAALGGALGGNVPNGVFSFAMIGYQFP